LEVKKDVQYRFVGRDSVWNILWWHSTSVVSWHFVRIQKSWIRRSLSPLESVFVSCRVVAVVEFVCYYVFHDICWELFP